MSKCEPKSDKFAGRGRRKSGKNGGGGFRRGEQLPPSPCAVRGSGFWETGAAGRSVRRVFKCQT